jgi:mono/diheme cytochrome c family protein
LRPDTQPDAKSAIQEVENIMWKQAVLLTLLIFIVAACSSATEETKFAGNADRGAVLFTKGTSNAPACSSCHTTSTSARRTGFHGGPTVAGIPDKLEKRGVELSAEEYIAQSIEQPDAYIVKGYSNMMFPNYDESFTRQQVADLVAYIMTLNAA